MRYKKLLPPLLLMLDCHDCGYSWDTNSEMEKVTCPNCNIKTSNTEPQQAEA